jgi:steroid delta-isomerase-like uncharacterized protein
MASAPVALVERFYDEVWNDANEKVAREILHEDFHFRGSLGPEERGQDGFIAYMRSIHAALADYTCSIEDIVATDDRVAARMIFKGVHRGEFFGVAPSGKIVRWAGAAFFRIAGNRIVELWVLGDVDSVKRQLGDGAASVF